MKKVRVLNYCKTNSESEHRFGKHLLRTSKLTCCQKSPFPFPLPFPSLPSSHCPLYPTGYPYREALVGTQIVNVGLYTVFLSIALGFQPNIKSHSINDCMIAEPQNFDMTQE